VADVDRVLTALFDHIDFLGAGSAAGSLIQPETAEIGLTIPLPLPNDVRNFRSRSP
jgi:hypothetical protein